MKNTCSFLRRIWNSIFYFAILILLIYLTNKFETYRGGIENSVLDFIKFEFLLIGIMALSVRGILKDGIRSYVLIGITVVGFYIFCNEFFIHFNRIPKLSDFSQLPELFRVISFSTSFLLISLMLIYCIFFLKLISLGKKKTLFSILIFSLLFFSIKVYPTLYIKFYNTLGFRDVGYDKTKAARTSGYLNYMFYEEARKNMALNSLNKVDLPEKKQIKINPKDTLRNIHLIVLESFYDPHMFRNISFSENPIFPAFSPYYKKQNLSISPVYGGSTAQSEFEILTGAPALNRYGSVEFNLFSGNLVERALPNILKRNGYLTVATNALSPDVFNAYNAYKSLGFDEQYYLSGNSYLKKEKQDRFIFDGDLLSQNYHFIDSLSKANTSKPVFNYVLGMYGHKPHSIDENKRPSQIEVYLNGGLVSENNLSRSVNQVFYRTKALQQYILKLKETDPYSMIVIVGDHLPSLMGIEKLGYYKNNLKLVPLYIIRASRPIGINSSNFHHFDIPELILDFVSKGKFNFSKTPEERYSEVIYQSVN